MARQTPAKSVAPFRPRSHQLMAQIRASAADSQNVLVGSHAEDRMTERGINFLDVVRTLRTGDIDGEIEAGSGEGEWKCKVVARKKGARDVGVVTVVLRNGRLFVKTVEWEDL